MATTNFVDGVTLTAAEWFNYVDSIAYPLTSVSGTNTITATGPSSFTGYATNQMFRFIPAATNTAATTLNVSTVGAKNVFYNGVACVGGELKIGVPALVVYDGTQFNLISSPGSRIMLVAEQASTSGTSIDFTGIPAGVKRITVMFKGVSTNGTADILFQLGDSGGPENSGYLGAGSIMSSAVASTAYTAGVGLPMGSAAVVLHGSITFTLERASTFSWAASGVFGTSDTARTITTGSSKSLSAELDRVRVTTSNGTDAFDAGAMSLCYEM